MSDNVPNHAVALERHSAVAVIRFARPQRMNPLGLEGDAAEIVGVLETLAADPEFKVLVVTGDGQAFSAGGDIKAMRDGMLSGPAPDVLALYRRRTVPLMKAFAEFEWPMIAAVNGAAIGLGCGIALQADMRIASDKARFGLPFLDMGLIPGDGSIGRLVGQLGYENAARLLFTGETIDAARALAAGMVSAVVPHDTLLDEALALAETIAAKPRLALHSAKLLLRLARGPDSGVGDLSVVLQSVLHQTTEYREGLAALLERTGRRSKP
jgi:enoyl-CoA hydratase/carnithine racemase